MRYLLCRDDYDAVLCKDGKYRDFVCFGNTSFCAKIYKMKGHIVKMRNARNASQEFQGNKLRYFILALPDDVIIDASLQLSREVDGQVEKLNRADYILKDERALTG